MSLLRITDDTTRPELEEAITSLRAKQRMAGLSADRERIGRAIDEMLDQIGSREVEV
jgi:hypothetical protein